MSCSRFVGRSIAWLAVLGMCLPLPAMAAESHAAEPSTGAAAISVADVELGQGGLLLGQVLDAEAQPLVDSQVTVMAGSQPVATAQTDDNGVFAVTGLRGGMHQLDAGESRQFCRLWSPGTAPPAAESALQMVAGGDTIRGQWGPPPGNGFLQNAKVWATNPFVVGGIVAAAVAIPVAIHNSDDDGPRS